MGLEVHILSEKPDDPAAQVVRHWHQGDPQKTRDLQDFMGLVDLVTFESEFYSGELLAEVQVQTKTPILPDPGVMSVLQDRLSQKEALLENHVPTAEFMAIHNKNDLEEARAYFKAGLVLKKRTGGYDGNGTFVIRNEAEWSETLHRISVASHDYIAEAYIPFKRELAVMMARNSDGEMVAFPLVQTFQTQNRCDWVMGPLKHPRLDNLVAGLAVFLEKLKYVGVIGFELFDTGRELLVNEIAPRVHNSGHYSLDALNVDQFTMHWLALLDFQFFEIKSKTPAFVMTNLIGANENSPAFPPTLTGRLHWYGKKQNRAGRKMGHINYSGSSGATLLRRALAERELIQNLGSGVPKTTKKGSSKRGKKK
jgi:5-(carboxyamino)imidazole ribonucleotide synthase